MMIITTDARSAAELVELADYAARSGTDPSQSTEEILEAVRVIRAFEREFELNTQRARESIRESLGQVLAKLREPAADPDFKGQRRASNDEIGKALGSNGDPDAPMPRSNTARFLLQNFDLR